MPDNSLGYVYLASPYMPLLYEAAKQGVRGEGAALMAFLADLTKIEPLLLSYEAPTPLGVTLLQCQDTATRRDTCPDTLRGGGHGLI